MFWKLKILSNTSPRYLNNEYKKSNEVKNKSLYKWNFKIHVKSKQ
jgi:hypothetical protein